MRKRRPMPETMTDKQSARFAACFTVLGADECWPWTGRCNWKGYGEFSTNCTNYKAHRLAYFLHHGIDPDDKLVCHSCDNPGCVNPAHLWLGTPLDNVRDRDAKGRGGKRPPALWPRTRVKALRDYRRPASLTDRLGWIMDYLEENAANGCGRAKKLVRLANMRKG